MQIKKVVILKCDLLLFYATTSYFSIGLWHGMKSVFYVTAGNDQLSDCTEKKLQSTPESQTCTKKWSWSLVVGHDPLQLSEFGESITSEKYAQQINEMKFKLQQKWPNSSLGQWQTGCHRIKSWTNWAMYLCLIHHTHLTSCQMITTSSSISTTFYRDNASKPTGGQNDFRRAHWTWSTGFYATEINKVNSHWQKHFDCNGVYFD